MKKRNIEEIAWFGVIAATSTMMSAFLFHWHSRPMLIATCIVMIISLGLVFWSSNE